MGRSPTRSASSGAMKRKGKGKRVASRSASRSGPSRRRYASPIPTSLAVDAIMANVGSQTEASLVSKSRSSKLGAGLPTLVSMTKSKASTMSGMAPRKRRQTRTRKPAARRNGQGYKVNWSGSGLPSVGGGGCVKTCPPKRPVLHKETCKCYANGSAALRKMGVCTPRVNKQGKVIETVYAFVDGKHRCLKAGGSTAKAKLSGKDSCPVGKVLKRYTAMVPQKVNGVWTQVARPATRCVKAVGEFKDCPVNQVLVQVPGRGALAGKSKTQRCVLPKTAAKKGYEVVRRGTLPIKEYRYPAMSPGM